MKRDTKKIILQKAFLLFLEKGYDAVSIRMIQEAADIGRATMYHYFTSKQELFEAVIQMNIEGAKASEIDKDYSSVLLSEYLSERIQKGRLSLENASLPEGISMLNYYLMNFQAMEINPSFADQGRELHDQAEEVWKQIITNSVVHGEVREDTDVEKTAKLFMNVRHGIGATSTLKTTMAENIDSIEEMYQYIFSLIKK